MSRARRLTDRAARIGRQSFHLVRACLRRHPLPERHAPITLFLAPEGGLTPYFGAHAIAAHVLSQEGHTALMLACSGDMPACSVKFASRLSPSEEADKDSAVCRRCRALRTAALSEYDLTAVRIDELLDEPSRRLVSTAMSQNREQPWQTVFDGIEFGAICTADVLREQRKLSVEQFAAEDLILLRAMLVSSLNVYLSVKVLIERYQVRRIVYFGDYAYWIAPQILAKRNRIALTNLSHGYNRDIDRRYLVMRSGFAVSEMLRLADEWPHFRNRPIATDRVNDIVDGALFRLGGSGGTTTYSPNFRARSARSRTTAFSRPRQADLRCLPEQQR